jgi:hypothetical protein
VQGAAVAALGAVPLGDRASAVIDNLLVLLRSSRLLSVETAVTQSLAATASGDRASLVIDKLLPLLESSDWEVRQNAVETLTAIPLGDRANQVIEKLLPLRRVQGAVARALGVIPPGDRTSLVIDKLLPLLGSSDWSEREAAVRALAAIPPGDRGDLVIDKLLPRLGETGNNYTEPAAQLLAKVGPGGAQIALAALAVIHDSDISETPKLRALAHIVTGADTKHEGSEVLLAWLGRPFVAPLSTIANNPIAAHEVLKTFDRYWPAIAANAGLRQEAEGRVVDVVHVACGTPVEGKSSDHGIGAALLWLCNQMLDVSMQRCWTGEQRRTLEHLLDGFQEAGYKDALKAHLTQER